jgi:hypothetical protein
LLETPPSYSLSPPPFPPFPKEKVKKRLKGGGRRKADEKERKSREGDKEMKGR